MSDTPFNRRKFLESSAGAAAVAGLGTGSALIAPLAHAQTIAFKPEKGATLRVLRWSRFVQGDIDAYMINVKKFTEKTGIEVRVDNEGWEDVRPKAAVAAKTLPAAKAAPVVAGGGTLRVNSRPWSQVFVDGKLVGNTPQLGISLAPGTHKLKLVSPDLGMTKQMTVQIEKGKATTKVVNLIE
jgi:hypothetical protein